MSQERHLKVHPEEVIANFKNKIYIMGKEQMKIKKGTNFGRKFFLWLFLWIRENSRTKMADLNLPFDNLVEVGFVKEI
jgi:KUP system potassium uptake protein